MPRNLRILKPRQLAASAGVRLWQHHIDFVQDVVTKDPEQNLNRLVRRGMDLVKLEMEGRIKILDAPRAKR